LGTGYIPHMPRRIVGEPFFPSIPATALAPDTTRTRSAADTLSLLLPLLPRFGITRLANITGLDTIGLPVYQAVRPGSRSLSVSQGKGTDATTAKISAVMESLESFHAEHARCSVRVETHRALSRQARVVDALRLPLAKGGRFHVDATLPWAEGYDLHTEEPLFVPYEMVHTNFTVPRLAGSGAFIPSTNGLGGGNHPAEAALHALCELIERDAETLWRQGGEPMKKATRVAIESVDAPAAKALIALFHRAGLELMIWEVTSDIRVPCFSVVVFDLESDPDLNPRPAAEGSGCHFDREIALCRALAEAAQSRLTSIAGSRDDFSTARYQAFQSRESLAHWRKEAAAPAERSFDAAPTAASVGTLDGDLEYVVARLAERGIDQIAVVNLSSDDVDLAFLRLVVVGLEGTTTSPSYTPGARAQARPRA
jgi:YcaO-like protein with predicted kinase domain